MKCAFIVTDVATTYRCRRCGFTLTGMVYPPERVHMHCSVARENACQHLGDKLGTRQCESCQGTVRIKLFDCEVHGQCTLGKRLDKLACCAQCGDYQPSKRDADADDGRSG